MTKSSSSSNSKNSNPKSCCFNGCGGPCCVGINTQTPWTFMYRTYREGGEDNQFNEYDGGGDDDDIGGGGYYYYASDETNDLFTGVVGHHNHPGRQFKLLDFNYRPSSLWEDTPDTIPCYPMSTDELIFENAVYAGPGRSEMARDVFVTAVRASSASSSSSLSSGPLSRHSFSTFLDSHKPIPSAFFSLLPSTSSSSASASASASSSRSSHDPQSGSVRSFIPLVDFRDVDLVKRNQLGYGDGKYHDIPHDSTQRYPLWGKFWDGQRRQRFKRNVDESSPPNVRTGDIVNVIAYLENPVFPDTPIIERFPVRVECVTTMGILVGTCGADLGWFKCDPGTLIKFHIFNIQYVRERGQNWK